MNIRQNYRLSSDVDVFESHDGQRILLFKRQTGELLLLLDHSVEVWRSLKRSVRAELNGDDRLILESFCLRGFIERGRNPA